MVEVEDGEPHPEQPPEAVQRVQQTHAVGTARDRGQHEIRRCDHVVRTHRRRRLR
jgi:hypothetical protein